ncbi:hypothetical protein, partial [Legionella sp.]|uniref:hypothetical protein n=1 Tax=Legionella sp. TaxID=459 RepID=UPI00321F8FC7
KLDTLAEQIKTTEAGADQLNQADEAMQNTIDHSQTLCQQVRYEMQQSRANDLEDQAFLAHLEQLTPQVACSNR